MTVKDKHWKEKYAQQLHQRLDLSQFNKDTVWKTVEAVHRFVQNRISYEVIQDDAQSPAELLERGKGDCLDVAVLVASLLHTQRVPYWIKHVYSEDLDVGHSFTEARMEELPDTWYDLAYSETAVDYYVSVDPVRQRRPGQLKPYLKDYYIQEEDCFEASRLSDQTMQTHYRYSCEYCL